MKIRSDTIMATAQFARGAAEFLRDNPDIAEKFAQYFCDRGNGLGAWKQLSEFDRINGMNMQADAIAGSLRVADALCLTIDIGPQMPAIHFVDGISDAEN